MRIVAGRHRGRRLLAPPGETVRPTSDRAREALFNILSHGQLAAEGVPFAGAAVLDAFAGTGALGLEALSRGAAAAAFIEQDREALATLRQNIAALGEERPRSDRSRRRDPPAARAFGVARWRFSTRLTAADSPPPALAALDAAGWLAPEALAVVEIAAREELAPPRRVYPSRRARLRRRAARLSCAAATPWEIAR